MRDEDDREEERRTEETVVGRNRRTRCAEDLLLDFLVLHDSLEHSGSAYECMVRESARLIGGLQREGKGTKRTFHLGEIQDDDLHMQAP